MKAFFKELYAYSHTYNQKLIDAILDHPDKTSEKALKLMNHILNAHQIWNNRLEPLETPFGVWEMHATNEFKAIDRANYERSLKLIDTLFFDTTIDYKTSAGQAFSNKVQKLLFHVINHSTYHRAQIATEFKNNGLEPIASDFILFKR